MRRKELAVIVLILAAAVVVAGCSKKGGANAKYVAYSSAVHKFSVEVPEEYKNFETQTQEHAGGAVTTTMYQSSKGDKMFMIAATPVEADPADAAQALEKGRDAVAQTGEEISRGETTLDGKPALSLRYKMNVDGVDVFYDGAFAFIGGIQYQVLFGSTKEEKLGDPAAKHFFESFKTITAAEAAEPAAGDEAAAGGGYTFEDLCEKLIAETKAQVGAAYSDAMGDQTRGACMAAADAYKGSPKADKAMSAFAGHILKACEGRSGGDWLTCYGSEAAAAGQAANDAVTKKEHIRKSFF